MKEFLTSVAWGGRGIGIGVRGARRGIGRICERIHIRIRVRVFVGFIFFFARTFMNFHRSQEAFIPAGHRAAVEGDGVRGALPAHHFCLTVPLSRRWILHPYLLTRREDGGNSFSRCHFCVRCLSPFHHCICIRSRKIPGGWERREPASGPAAEHDVGGGAAVGPGAIAELGQGRLEVGPFLDALDEQLLDVLDGCLRQPVGLGVVRAAGLVEDAVVLAVRLECLAAELS